MLAQINNDLLSDLARQRVVLFLGAGVSASAVTASATRIAGWGAFLKSVAEDHAPAPLRRQVLKLLKGKDFLLACELLQRSLPDEWGSIVADEFGQVASPSPLHEALINLDQRIILTTNFDKLVESSWTAFAKSQTHFPSVISRVDDRIFRILKDHDGRYLIKIHGTVDDSESMIFSRSEYIRLAFGNQNYGHFLESLLLNYTFLFVGFSMDDPAITGLMELYALRYPRARPHYIFVPKPVPDNIMNLQRDLRKLHVIDYNSANNHKNLPEMINELANLSLEKRRELIASSLSSSVAA